MSRSDFSGPPYADIFDGGETESHSGSLKDLSFDFNAPHDTPDFLGDALGGERTGVQSTAQNTPERAGSSPASDALSTDELFSKTPEGAQSPAQSIPERAGPSPNTHNWLQAEQTEGVGQVSPEVATGNSKENTNQTSKALVQFPTALDAGESQDDTNDDTQQYADQAPQVANSQDIVSQPIIDENFQLRLLLGSFSTGPQCIFNQPAGPTSTPQGTLSQTRTRSASTTPQPQTVPNPSESYFTSLLNSQGFDVEAFQNEHYPLGPLEGNYADHALPAEPAVETSAINPGLVDPTILGVGGSQASAQPTAPNPAGLAQGFDPSFAYSGEAVQRALEYAWNNTINPSMSANSWAQQTPASAAAGLVYPTQAVDPSLVFPGGAVQKMPRVDPGLIDPAIIADFESKHGPVPAAAIPGGTTAPQPAYIPAPAPMPAKITTPTSTISGTMPNLTAPLAIPTVPTGPYPMLRSATVQPPRRSRPASPNSQPVPGSISQAPTSYSSPAAWEEPEPQKRRLLVHHRGKTSVDPSEVYRPLDVVPESWGPPAFEKLFSYTKHGEWEGPLRLSQSDISFYISNAKQLAKRNLKIWIQHCPAQRNYRYPSPVSAKCRWDQCPATNNTIMKGFYRVAFDERSDVSGKVTDPFHNAGYIHLHCFEKLFDVFELIKLGFAAIDNRDFPYEDRNPMSVMKEHPQLAKTFKAWCYAHGAAYVRYSQAKAQGGPRRRLIPKEQRLWSVLTRQALELESDTRVKIRDARDGNSIDKHKGDLDEFVAADRKRRILERKAKRVAEELDDGVSTEEDAPRVKRARCRRSSGRKRVVEIIDSEGSASEGEVPRAKRAPHNYSAAGKRATKEIDDGESSSEEVASGSKRVRHGKRRARAHSPARSHIIVRGSNNEDGPTEESVACKMTVLGASPPPAECPSPKRTSQQRKRKTSGDHDDTHRPKKRPWDADLRQGWGDQPSRLGAVASP